MRHNDLKMLTYVEKLMPKCIIICHLQFEYRHQNQEKMSRFQCRIDTIAYISLYSDVYEEIGVLPTNLVQIWEPLINKLMNMGASELLLDNMVTMVTDDVTFKNCLLCGWIIFLLNGNTMHLTSVYNH